MTYLPNLNITMKRQIFAIILLIAGTAVSMAEDSAAAERYQREAEYYQRQAESHQRDAESYLRDAKSKERDAAYYIRNKKYDRARDSFRSAANAMDRYESRMQAAARSASTAEDYLKRAADALR